MKGAKPIPTAIKALRGNPGRRPLNKAEPKLPVIREAPPAPEFLGDIARAKWDELAAVLTPAGVLTKGDLHNLECLCAAYERWRKAEEIVSREGFDIDGKKHPAVTVVNEAQAQMRAFGALLGLDPSSRSRLEIGEPQRDEHNPFALLPGGRA